MSYKAEIPFTKVLLLFLKKMLILINQTVNCNTQILTS